MAYSFGIFFYNHKSIPLSERYLICNWNKSLLGFLNSNLHCMYNTILKSSFLSADDVKKISQRRQREPDLQESILKSLDISKFIIFIWSYCMLKFFLDGKLYWKIHRCTYMETTVQERENCFFFEVFVRFFQFNLKVDQLSLTVGRLVKALWKNSLNDNISVGVDLRA